MKPDGWQPQDSTIQTNNIKTCLKALGKRLANSSETASLDAQVLIAHMTGHSRSWVLAHTDEILDATTLADLERAVTCLVNGEPLPYLLGHWEFYRLDFIVTPDVLIPRPETELLVEKALQYLRGDSRPKRVLDVGTGSGCIAISLAANMPGPVIYASDLSQSALLAARQNAYRIGVGESIHFFQGDVLSSIVGSFDLICANLPYIPTAKLAALPVALHEPNLALDGGANGLTVIQRLITDAPRLLAPKGLLLLEIESNQGSEVLELAKESFPRALLKLERDLIGLDRLVSILNQVSA